MRKGPRPWTRATVSVNDEEAELLRCSKCRNWRLRGEFHVDARKSRGCVSKCKACCRREWRKPLAPPRKCAECPTIFQGRSDKRYCSDRCVHRGAARRRRARNPVTSVVRKNQKQCRKCASWKNLTEYKEHRQGLAGRAARCLDCQKQDWAEFMADPVRRERRYKMSYARKYGLSLEEYEQLFAQHGNACAICGRAHSFQGARLAVDHCHQTKRVRGLLCVSCNASIGHFRDDPALLRSAADYLERAA